MNIAAKRMMSLLQSEVTNNPVDKGIFAGMLEEEWCELTALSRKHDVAHLVCEALVASNVELDAEFRQNCEKIAFKAAWRTKYMIANQNNIEELFQQNSIPFILLKGSVMRNYYPREWRRTSCDIDILVRKEDFALAKQLLLAQSGYEKYSQTDHDVSFWSDQKILIELHHSVSYTDDANDSFTDDFWNDAKPVDNTVEYTVPDAMFYCSHINHMAKHVVYGGCGVRPFLDLWILDNFSNVDLQARTMLLEEYGLMKFANAASELCQVWYEGKDESDTTALLSEYILNGGAYGSKENMTAVGTVKKKSSFRYIISRFWLPYEQLCCMYPSLEGKRFLQPFYEFRRILRIVNPKTFRRGVAEMKYSKSLSLEERMRTAEMLLQLGLRK